MPAYEAGIMPGMTIVAVNGRKYSAEVLHDAVKAAKNSSVPIALLVENSEYCRSYAVNYHDGDRCPHVGAGHVEAGLPGRHDSAARHARGDAEIVPSRESRVASGSNTGVTTRVTGLRYSSTPSNKSVSGFMTLGTERAARWKCS